MGPPKTSTKQTTRWRPTPEQVMILEGLFKGGVTTPTALQIQKITSQLKEYGKVESKNVFYWFQNHKAREKQKLRRKLHHHQQNMHNNNNNNNNLLFYYFYLPTQFPSPVCPIFPAHQGMRDFEGRSMENEEMKEGDNECEGRSSMVKVTWLATDSTKERPKTLQLFPTTSGSTMSS